MSKTKKQNKKHRYEQDVGPGDTGVDHLRGIQFSTRQYDNVTLPDLERATVLTRGTVICHFGNKQELFNAAVEGLLPADKISVPDIPARDSDVLKSFIEAYVSNCEARRRVMTDRGIANASLAYHIVECSSRCFFDDFGRRSREMRDRELDIRTLTITRAIERKEIADSVKPEVLASPFIDLSAGNICSSTKAAAGCDAEQMRGEPMAIYDLVKIE